MIAASSYRDGEVVYRAVWCSSWHAAGNELRATSNEQRVAYRGGVVQVVALPWFTWPKTCMLATTWPSR